MQIANRPGEVRAAYGEVFTRDWVVEAILDLVGYSPADDLTARTVVEPACGAGAFLVPIIERLLASARRIGRSFDNLGNCIRAFDLQPDHVEMCQKKAIELLQLNGCSTTVAKQLATTWVQAADFLLDDHDLTADFVVGNPPYVRLEDIPKPLLTEYRTRWPAMTGRADLYIGFIERMLSLLAPGGRVGVICADRWLRNHYGRTLRGRIADGFAVECVWSLRAVEAFDDPVAAYPAIVVLSHAGQGRVTVIDTTADFRPETAGRIVRWARGNRATLSGQGFTAYRARQWTSGRGPWPSATVARLQFLDDLTSRHPALEDPETGTRISIGVATGADDVYLTRDPTLVEPDRLLPLAMTADIADGSFAWGGIYLVNPWEDGALVELSSFPRLESYLHSNSTRLGARHIARVNPARWYRTIDNVRAGIQIQPKLLLPDMKSSIHPVLERGGHYPHHNLYYITSRDWDLEVLGGLLLSRVAQAFIEAYCVRMRGETLRFQAQYLRQIRVPRPDRIGPRLADQLRTAFRRRDVEMATCAAIEAYGVQGLPT